MLLLDLLLDNVVDCQMFSFMNGFNSYNQICMAPKDAEKIYTPIGVLCYTLMPFRLKNGGTMYQRVMQNIFFDMLHKGIEDYVDDHYAALERILHSCRVYNSKLNPNKCAFAVSPSQFLGFFVHERGIIFVDRFGMKRQG